jgi:hypothetical protein
LAAKAGRRSDYELRSRSGCGWPNVPRHSSAWGGERSI